MERRLRTCDNCGGTGKSVTWKIVNTDKETGIGTMESEETICTSCNGSGWIDYAVFSVKEAEAILKYCGLPVDNE